MPKELQNAEIDEGELGRVEAIICSMTPAERRDPSLINGSRRLRIAQGSGTTTQEVNALLKQFKMVQQMMQSMTPGQEAEAARSGPGLSRPRSPGGPPGPDRLRCRAAPAPAPRAGALDPRPRGTPLVAVKIRLMRVGKKKQPTYRVVVADGRSPRDGRFIEIIGHYGPRQEPSASTIDDERSLGWLRKGAQPTEQVQKLLVGAGVWERYESERKRESPRHEAHRARPRPRARPAEDTAKAEARRRPRRPTADGRGRGGRGRRRRGRAPTRRPRKPRGRGRAGRATRRATRRPSERRRRADDDELDDDFEDEVGGEGNRIVGARAKAVVEHVTREHRRRARRDRGRRRGAARRGLAARARRPDDMGRLIGRRGRVIQALRQVTRAAGAAEGVKATVDVVE